MKNRHFFSLPIIFSLILLISSCGLDSMVSKFNTLNFTVTPTQVEVHGGNIDIELEVKIPEKYFLKSAEADFRAMLAPSADSENKVFFDPVKLQGEKISSNGKTIGFITGGQFTYKGTIKYSEEMADYDLFATAIATMNDNSKSLGAVKVAEGVMATSTRVMNSEVPAVSDHTYEKVTVLEETAVIYFTVNQSNVRYSQKSSDEIKKLKEFAKLGYETKNIEISSFASPEGTLDVNDKVSDNRANSTFSYAKKLMKQLKVDGAKNDDLYIQSSKGEDWRGFNKLVNSSDMKDKSKVLNIVRNQKDPQKREESIRDMAEIYDAIENDVLPKLRKATITLRVFEPKKTDEEIASLAIADPAQLDIKEMLYAASLIEDNSIKKTIYNATSKSFANDYRAYNNLAGIYIQEKNMNKAIDMLGKASKYNANAAEVKENQGIIAAIEGDYNKAASLYNSSNASDVNKGILAIKTGDYSSATSKLKGNDYNATLAKIMNGNPVVTTDNSAAGNYLNAIVNARTGNTDKCIEFLSKAIEIDANYKNEAKKDFEFKKLKDNVGFQALIN
ncbi:MAG: tetratricopeptide repeat protein [Flavobacteriales bacterium]|nr:tetratricopeptide repeat protein [Flavobacteriales bacterium]